MELTSNHNTYLRKPMENDITDKDFQNFKAFAAKATKIMNWIMRKGDS